MTATTPTATPRHIIIDALAARFGGTAYATVHLARHLSRAAEVDRVWVVARRESIVERGLRDAEGVSVVILGPGGPLELLRRLAWEAWHLPRLVRSYGATDVVTLSGMLPLRLDVPVTSYLLNPVAFRDAGLANRVRRRLIRRTSASAASIVVPSVEMQRLVEAETDRPAAVVPLGIDRAMFGPAESPGRDLLCVADFYPHKRHDLVLDAWEALDAPRPRLRLIGNPEVDPAHAEWVAERAGRLAEQGVGDVVVEHQLPIAELARAYRSARAFVLPSERESFCMPVIEALASGVPGVVRDMPVLRETGDDGCDDVDADDAGDWAAVIGRLLRDDAHHAQLRTAGLRHAERFSFERMTEGLLRRMGLAAGTPVRAAARLRENLLPLGFATLLVLVAISALVSRDTDRARPAMPADTPAEMADNSVFGSGLDDTVDAPLPELRSQLGATWHVLKPPVGRLAVTPTGDRGPYFSVAFVAYAPDDAARLQILTSGGEKQLASIANAKGHAALIFGPFKMTGKGQQGLALFPVDRTDPGPGPELYISPVEARYLQPGEPLLRQTALQPRGAGGLRGLPIAGGATAAIRVAPGVRGEADVKVVAVAQPEPTRITVKMGGKRRGAIIDTDPDTVRVGPLPADDVVRVTVRRASGRPGEVLLSSVSLLPAE
jgi:glycosyltransferase involved in cell wall biosynthesis